MLTPDVKKTIVAFANTEGGTLYVGVADDGTPIGVDDPGDVVLKLTNMARDSIRPDVTMFAKAKSLSSSSTCRRAPQPPTISLARASAPKAST